MLPRVMQKACIVGQDSFADRSTEHQLETMKLNRESVLKSIILARRLVRRMYHQVNTTKDIDILKDLLRDIEREILLKEIL